MRTYQWFIAILIMTSFSNLSVLAAEPETDCACPDGMKCCQVTLSIDPDLQVTTLDSPASIAGLIAVCGMPGSDETLQGDRMFTLVPAPGPMGAIGSVSLTLINAAAGGPIPSLNLQVEAASGNCLTLGTRPTLFTPNPLYYQKARLDCEPANGTSALCTVTPVDKDITLDNP